MKKLLLVILFLASGIFVSANIDQILDTITLKPKATAPTCDAATAGLIYVDSSSGLNVCDGTSWTASAFEYAPAIVTVASGNYTAATPDKASYQMTFSSSGGSFVFGETSATTGQALKVCNSGSNSFSIADSSGVSETAGTLTVGQFECYGFTYLSDRWVLDNSNN